MEVDYSSSISISGQVVKKSKFPFLVEFLFFLVLSYPFSSYIFLCVHKLLIPVVSMGFYSNQKANVTRLVFLVISLPFFFFSFSRQRLPAKNVSAKELADAELALLY